MIDLDHPTARTALPLAAEIDRLRAVNAELLAALRKSSATLAEISNETKSIPIHANGLPDGPLAAKLMLIGAACRGNLAWIRQNCAALAKAQP